MAYTSVLNVDNKVSKSNCDTIFDTDLTVVVCDNSSNTHIYNDQSVFTEFKGTKIGIVATTGRELNKHGRSRIVEWKRKDDNGVICVESLEKVL